MHAYKQQKFIKDWYYQEYYNEAMEAIEELNALLPALEEYAADSYVADTITNAKKKIAQAEANIPQAKVKFEAEPLKDQVSKTQQRLDVSSPSLSICWRVG
jgi:predicted extracellular nuclease